MADWSSYRPVLQFLGRWRGIQRILTWSAGDSVLRMAEQWPDAEILCLESDAGYSAVWRQRYAHLPKVTVVDLPQGVPFGGSQDYACYPLRTALASGADPAAYDFVFIDGRARCDCLTVAYLVAKPDGIVVLHDAERENYAPGIALFPFVHRVEKLGVAVMSRTELDLTGLEEHLAGALALEESRAQRERERAFPRPAGRQDVLLEDSPHGLSPGEIFALLTSPEARPALPAPQPYSLRGLVSGGWFFKARPGQRQAERRLMLGELAQARRTMASLDVWHPQKTWFLLYDACDYWLCNASPLLRPLDEASMREQWRLLRLALAMSRRVWLQGWWLDPRPCNFGVEDGSGQLFYLDDEIYPLNRILRMGGRRRAASLAPPR